MRPSSSSSSGPRYDFRDCFFPTCDPARSWVTSDGMARLGGPTLAIVDVSLTDAELGPAVEQRLAAAFGDDAVGVNTWPDTRGDLLTETDFFAAFLGVFGVFVLVASGVVIAAALTARTVARRRRIGLYKAIGGTPAQITTALVVEHLAVALGAGLLGWLAATRARATPRRRFAQGDRHRRSDVRARELAAHAVSLPAASSPS